jgi:hypothetical protein
VPTAASALEFVWTVQVLTPRVIFHVQATETWSPSASVVVVEAVSGFVFVVGDVGLKAGWVNAGGVLIVVVAVAVLFPVVVSFGDDTVALFVRVIVPVPPGAVTVIVIGAAAAGARFTFPVGVHVTVPEALAQVQFALLVALTNETPAGSVSTTWTSEAGSGPPFVTLSV